jgi:hypothetical protein
MPSAVSEFSWADLPGVSIDTDSEAVGLGVRSLLTPVLGDVWRSTGAGDVPGQRRLSIDLGTPRPVRVLVLQAPRDGLLPEAGAVIRASLSAMAAGGQEAGFREAPLDMPRGYWTWTLDQTVLAQHLQLLLLSSQPYLQFGRLWLGDAMVTPAYLAEGNHEPAVSDAPGEPTRRRVQFTLPSLTQDQADQLEDIGLSAGTQRQVLAIPRVERGDRSAVLGKLASIPAPKPRQAWGEAGQWHTATLSVQEDR